MNWYKIAIVTKNYGKSIQEHVKGVLEADLSYPIFVTQEHYIIDGAHRTIKAKLMGQQVPAIVLTQEELNKTILPPEDNYTGQVYVSDFSGDKEEYAVNEIIRLYQNKPATNLNPDSLLAKNGECWGSVSPYEVMEIAQQKMGK